MTYLILTFAILFGLVAPTAHAVPAISAMETSNASVEATEVDAKNIQVIPTAVDGIETTSGNTKDKNASASPQRSRPGIISTDTHTHTIGTEAMPSQDAHTAVEAVRNRMQEVRELYVEQIEGIRAETQERLSDIPRWIIGVCSDTASCEEMKEALKERCEELTTATTDASGITASNKTCATIEELTCADIEEYCAYISEEREYAQERLDEVRAKIEEQHGEIKAEREEEREALREEVKERIEAYVARLVDRINAAIERLEGLADRAEERITILESEGIDIGEAQASVENAHNHLNTAVDYLTDITALTADALASDTPRESTTIVKEAISAAAEEARAARADLEEMVLILKSTTGDAE